MDLKNQNRLYSRLQFLRALDVHCSANHVNWNLFGKFLRDFFRGDNIEFLKVDMEIYLRCDYGISFCKFIKSMQITGLINNIKGYDTHYNATAAVTLNNVAHTFPVIFYMNRLPDCTIAFDNLALTSAGLCTLRTDSRHDELNLNTGIAVFERLIDTRCKNAKLTKRFFNLPDNVYIRYDNAQLIKLHSSLIEDGYKIIGSNTLNIRHDTAFECPICFENKSFYTILKCEHSFCLSCIANHFEHDGDNHGKCPLCRRSALLELI